ncbi:MAG: 3-oxoacyl-[acyl-carrier-protein] reductase [Phycisphaerae bacterium]|nr:3-oxoacyl-[acyl-carrier-protein] reductase [Phycisphaerae bacterium]
MTENSDQRVAFVTGASRGIGRAISERLAADGRHVVLASRSEAPLNDLKATIEANGGSASVCVVDVGDGESLAGAVETVAKERGRFDILVNNAGITRDNLILRMDDEAFDEVIRVNLRSAFVACRAAARPMMKGKFGRVVNIASTSGLVGNAGQANYAASKAGLVGLTRTLARELGSKGVTANVVAPGFIETDMTKDLPEAVLEGAKATISVKRLGRAEDIAAAVSYVTSDDAGFLTGQVITVDGGMTMA